MPACASNLCMYVYIGVHAHNMHSFLELPRFSTTLCDQVVLLGHEAQFQAEVDSYLPLEINWYDVIRQNHVTYR